MKNPKKMRNYNFSTIIMAIIISLAPTANAAYDLPFKDILKSKSAFGVIEDGFLSVSGYYSGLIIHEIGHISSVEYLGGKFEEFDGPYGPLGEPTLWMSGNKLQYGAAAMMGNNFSNMTASYMLNKYNPATTYENGILLFSILNPILYSISDDSASDFETASKGLGYTELDLRKVNLIPAATLAIKALTRGSEDYYGNYRMDVGLNGKYLKVTNTGPVYALQKYSYIDSNMFSNIGIGVRLNDYLVEYGKYRDDSLPINEYVGVGKTFNFSPTSDISLKAIMTEDSEAKFEVEYDNEYGFLNYSGVSEDVSLGLKVEF